MMASSSSAAERHSIPVTLPHPSSRATQRRPARPSLSRRSLAAPAATLKQAAQQRPWAGTARGEGDEEESDEGADAFGYTSGSTATSAAVVPRLPLPPAAALPADPARPAAMPKEVYRWLSALRAAETLPLPLDPAPRTGKRTTYFLHIRGVEGVRLPDEFARRVPREETAARLHVSFFSLKARAFFGRTYVGPRHPLGAVGAHSLYFASRVNDDSCVAVVELVVERVQDGAATERFGAGWATMQVFSKGRALCDAAEADLRHGDRCTRRPFFAGSPRALLFVDAERDWQKSLLPAAGLAAHFALYTHRALAPVAHLFRDDELLGPGDAVGGLHMPRRCLPAQPAARAFDHSPPPELALRVTAPRVWLPAGFERRLLANLRHLREDLWEPVLEGDRAAPRVAARRLVLGLHNGRTFVCEPAALDLRPVHAAGGGTEGATALAFEGECWLRALALVAEGDSALAVVAELEYAVEWAHAASRAPPATTTVSAGWTARLLWGGVPVDGSRHAVPLQRGPGRSARGLMVYGGDGFAGAGTRAEGGGGGARLPDYPECNPITLEVSLLCPQLADERPASPAALSASDGPPSPAREPASPRSTVVRPARRAPAEQFAHRGWDALPEPSSRHRPGFGRESLDLRLELDDPMRISTFSVDVTGLSRPNRLHREAPLSSVRVSFYFFNQPAFLSERVALQPDDGARVHHDGEEHRFAFRAHFSATVSALEHAPFVEYLFGRDLYVDVWDDESQMHVGTARLPLYPYLRQGREELERREVVPLSDGAVWGTSDVAAAAAAADRMPPAEGAAGSIRVTVRHIGIEPTHQERVEADAAAQVTIPSSPGESMLVGGGAGGPAATPPPRGSGARVVARRRAPDADADTATGVPLNTTCSSARKVKAHLLAEEEPALRSTLRGAAALPPRGSGGGGGEAAGSGRGEGERRRPRRRHDRETVHGTPTRVVSRRGRRRPGGPDTTPIRRPPAQRPEDAAERGANLEKIRRFRESVKGSVLARIMRESVTQRRKIFPSAGRMVFFEVEFTNPFPERREFSLRVADPAADGELRPVSDEAEWGFYRHKFGGGRGRMRAGLFVGESRIALGPGERAAVPFRFQSMLCGDVGGLRGDSRAGAHPAAEGASVLPRYEPVARRTVEVAVESAGGKAVAVLQVDVEPQPFAVDRTFRVHHWAGEVLKYRLPLHPPGAAVAEDEAGAARGEQDAPPAGLAAGLMAERGRRVRRVRCSSDAVAVDFRDDLARNHRQVVGGADAGVAHDGARGVPLDGGTEGGGWQASVAVRCTVPEYPAEFRFFVLTFTDEYACGLAAVYEVRVRAAQRADVHAVVGQETRGRLVLPPVPVPHTVRVFASGGADLAFGLNGPRGAPSPPFQLVPGAVNQLAYSLRTADPGARTHLVHMVDEQRRLLHTWLLRVDAVHPQVDREYPLRVPVGRVVRKRLPYTNDYNGERTFHLLSSDPARMRLPAATVTIPALSTGEVELLFEARDRAGTAAVFLFVNDERGRNEQCLRFSVTFEPEEDGDTFLVGADGDGW